MTTNESKQLLTSYTKDVVWLLPQDFNFKTSPCLITKTCGIQIKQIHGRGGDGVSGGLRIHAPHICSSSSNNSSCLKMLHESSAPTHTLFKDSNWNGVWSLASLFFIRVSPGVENACWFYKQFLFVSLCCLICLCILPRIPACVCVKGTTMRLRQGVVNVVPHKYLLSMSLPY